MCLKNQKSNFAVRGLIWMKFWHKLIWPQIVLTVPSDFHKTRLGRALDQNVKKKWNSENRFWGTFMHFYAKKI